MASSTRGTSEAQALSVVGTHHGSEMGRLRQRGYGVACEQSRGAGESVTGVMAASGLGG